MRIEWVTETGSRYEATSDIGGMRWRRLSREEQSGILLHEGGPLTWWPDVVPGCCVEIRFLRSDGNYGLLRTSRVVGIVRD